MVLEQLDPLCKDEQDFCTEFFALKRVQTEFVLSKTRATVCCLGNGRRCRCEGHSRSR